MTTKNSFKELPRKSYQERMESLQESFRFYERTQGEYSSEKRREMWDLLSETIVDFAHKVSFDPVLQHFTSSSE